MSDPYEKAKGGRLTFKGGSVATRSKAIDKKKKKKSKKKSKIPDDGEPQLSEPEIVTLANDDVEGGGGDLYTIDAAKRMKYEQLFPVESKKFGYDPNNPDPKLKSVEDALDDRVKKKADRYCK